MTFSFELTDSRLFAVGVVGDVDVGEAVVAAGGGFGAAFF